MLSLRKVDSTMMGNYSCAAENLLGESEPSNPAEVLVKCELDILIYDTVGDQTQRYCACVTQHVQSIIKTKNLSGPML